METLYDVLRALAHACRGFLAEADLHKIRAVIDLHDPAIAEAERIAATTMSDAETATLSELLAKAERVQAAQQQAPAAPAEAAPAAVHGFQVAAPAPVSVAQPPVSAAPAAPTLPPANTTTFAGPAAPVPPDPNFLPPRTIAPNPPPV